MSESPVGLLLSVGPLSCRAVGMTDCRAVGLLVVRTGLRGSDIYTVIGEGWCEWWCEYRVHEHVVFKVVFTQRLNTRVNTRVHGRGVRVQHLGLHSRLTVKKTRFSR